MNRVMRLRRKTCGPGYVLYKGRCIPKPGSLSYGGDPSLLTPTGGSAVVGGAMLQPEIPQTVPVQPPITIPTTTTPVTTTPVTTTPVTTMPVTTTPVTTTPVTTTPEPITMNVTPTTTTTPTTTRSKEQLASDQAAMDLAAYASQGASRDPEGTEYDENGDAIMKPAKEPEKLQFGNISAIKPETTGTTTAEHEELYKARKAEDASTTFKWGATTSRPKSSTATTSGGDTLTGKTAAEEKSSSQDTTTSFSWGQPGNSTMSTAPATTSTTKATTSTKSDEPLKQTDTDTLSGKTDAEEKSSSQEAPTTSFRWGSAGNSSWSTAPATAPATTSTKPATTSTKPATTSSFRWGQPGKASWSTASTKVTPSTVAADKSKKADVDTAAVIGGAAAGALGAGALATYAASQKAGVDAISDLTMDSLESLTKDDFGSGRGSTGSGETPESGGSTPKDKTWEAPEEYKEDLNPSEKAARELEQKQELAKLQDKLADKVKKGELIYENGGYRLPTAAEKNMQANLEKLEKFKSVTAKNQSMLDDLMKLGEGESLGSSSVPRGSVVKGGSAVNTNPFRGPVNTNPFRGPVNTNPFRGSSSVAKSEPFFGSSTGKVTSTGTSANAATGSFYGIF